jgi:3-deoxy-manno-octulosonate cytidylyltransferase (CMP-KDO synthetase)
MKIAAIIPARYASTRFPGKPLADIAGKTMIQRVYEQCKQINELAYVIVATDDERIYQKVIQFGGQACMTSSQHLTGTDRIWEVVEKLNLAVDVIINVQGDEPFIQPSQIQNIIDCFQDPNAAIATLVKPIQQNEVLFNVNAPKVVLDDAHFALYFSRQAIPFLRNEPTENWLNNHTYYQHIGIYGFRKDVLQKLVKLAPSKLEQAESLEQLRWLAAGYKIKTATTHETTIAIDTPEDLEIAIKLYNQNTHGN